MDGSKQKQPARTSEADQVPGARFARRVKKMVSFFFSFCIVSVIGLAVFLLYLRSQALPATSLSHTSQIVDVHGDLIDEFHSGENRQVVSLDDISPFLVNATIAIEDHRFYEHLGFDMKGIARAAWVDMTHMAKVQGASTLTQQLARNLYLNHDRTWTRKMKEAVYTIQLEMQYSKKEILAQYLNQIYYGHGAYGIQAASKLYFGKNAKDLTLAESAMLAGIPKSWKYYSPHMDFESAKSRQKVILQTMSQHRFITEQKAEEAYNEKLDILPLTERKQTANAPYFRDYVRSLAAKKLGVKEEWLETAGVTIYTTLDLRAQKIAEEVVTEQLNDSDQLQAALVAIDPRNGYVKAMVGGKDYNENQYNRVFAKTRQPGSSFKPIVYLTALQNPQFSAVTQYRSEPTVFTYDNGRKTYTPRNFGDKYPDNPLIDLREAISKSDNIYAVHTIEDVGPEKVIEMARKLGISSDLKPLPSLALGASPVSPFEMASVFGTIANQGVREEPTAILKIVNTDGTRLYEAEQHEEKVVEPAYTYVLTKLMESVFEPGGTASRVSQMLKRPVAGKTGTTDTDSWMVGFTPELATAVWVGYDRDKTISAVDSRKAAPIFADFTEKTLEPIPPKIFPIPDGVVSVYIDPSTGKLATSDCPAPRLETFVAGTEPQDYCSEHGSAGVKKKKPSAKHDNSSWWDDMKRWWND